MYRSIFTIIQAFLLLIGSAAIANAQYRYPDDDLRVALRLDPINEALALMVSKVYALTYNNNGAGCSNPNISFTITKAEVDGLSTLKLRSGSVETRLVAEVKIKAEISRCIGTTVRVDISCKGTLPMSWLPPGWRVRPRCEFRIRNVPFMDYDLTLDRPTPLLLPDDVEVRLPPATARGNVTVDLQFGKYDGTRWVAEPSPKNKVREWPVSGHLMWEPNNPLLIPVVGDPVEVHLFGEALVGAVSIGHERRYETTGVARSAVAGFYFGDRCFWQRPLCAGVVSMKSTLLAPPTLPNPGDPTYGVVGGLFPLMVSATYTGSDFPFEVGLRLVVSGASARISDDGSGRPKLDLAISVEQLEAFDPATGRVLTADLAVQPSLGLVGPLIEADGDLVVAIDSVGITVIVKDTSHSVTIPLGDILKDNLVPLVPKLANIGPNLNFEVPNCINANQARVVAETPCADYGGERQGYISIRNPGGALSYGIDFSRTRITARPGEVKMVLWPYR